MASSSGIQNLPSSVLFQRILDSENTETKKAILSEASLDDLSNLFKTLVTLTKNNSLSITPNEDQSITGKPIIEESEEVKKFILKIDTQFNKIVKGLNYKIIRHKRVTLFDIDETSTDENLKLLKNHISFIESVFGPNHKIIICLKPSSEISSECLMSFMSRYEKYLNSLNLSSRKVDDAELKDLLTHCSNLVMLTIGSHKIKGYGLDGINGLRYLQSLNLSDCTSLVSLTLTDLPALQGIFFSDILSTPFNQQLIFALFNLAKSSTYNSLIDNCIRIISRHCGEDHEYVQQLILQYVYNAENAHPNNPYRIHRELLEKEAVAVAHQPTPCQTGSIRFNINTNWIQEPPQLPFIPFSYSKFEALLSKVEQKLKPGSKALLTFNEFFPDCTFDSLKADISVGFYRQYLDGSESQASSSSAPPQDKVTNRENRLSVTSHRLRKILQCIENLHAVAADDDLNDGDKAFIQMLINVRTCGSGKITGVDYTYYSMAEEKTYGEAELIEKGPLERIEFYIKEELRRRRYNAFSIENAHDKTYNLNLLGRELGLYARGEKPKMDMNGNCVSLGLRNLSKQEALNLFYKEYTTKRLIEWVYDLFNGNQIQIGDSPLEKWTVVSQTLNNTQEGDREAKVWDPKYIRFNPDDTIRIYPVGITYLAAAVILTKLGVLIDLDEQSRDGFQESPLRIGK